jgi:outer membrane immunogenic protein
MKKFLLASASILALGIASAQAADIPQRMPAKAPMYVAPVYNWTGPYIGINGGGGWGSGMSGGLIGGTLGYNWQVGTMVYGLEGDLDWSNIHGSGNCAVIGCDTRNHWLGTVRGRLGVAMDRFMPYVTGGLAVGDVQNSVAGFGSATSTKAGWTLGAGIETALAQNWTAKFEYLYVDLGHGPTVAGIAGSDTRFRSNVLRVGLNYRF